MVRNNSMRASRRHLLQRILVVKSAENWLAPDDVPGGDAVATPILRRGLLERCRYPRAKAQVRWSMVEMSCPRFQNQIQRALLEGNEEVQALAA